MNPFTALKNYFFDDLIRTPEDLKKALEDVKMPDIKIYVIEKEPEVKIYKPKNED